MVDPDPSERSAAPMRVAHVLSDGWFTDVVGRAFEAAGPGANTFIAVGFDPSEVRVPDGAAVVSVSSSPEGVRQLGEIIAESQVAVFHNLTRKVAPALASAPSSVLRVWSGWGGDYYGSVYDPYAHQLDPATRKLVNGFVRPTFWAGQALRSLRVTPMLRRAARAADVFSAPVPQDLAIFRRRFRGFEGQYLQLNYATIEDSIATGSRPEFGDDVLLGNSASPTNNHVDLLEILATQDLGGRRVVAPLSYGDPAYAAAVARVGKTLLGDRFVAIRDFLPLDEYNALVGRCGVVVMGHRRQEGLGNVLRALWQGARVVLDSRNPIAVHLRGHGLEIDSVGSLSASGVPSEAVSSGELQARMHYLEANWSRVAAARNADALLTAAGSR